MSFPAELTIDVRGGARRKITAATVRELGRLLRRAMRAAGVGGRAMTLSLSDDAELLALNRQFAGEDHATDVLSFPQAAPLLGDVIISVATADKQARAAGHSLRAELVHLAVHGLAHLMGFDHASPEEERVMFGFEARLRAAASAAGEVVRVTPPRNKSVVKKTKSRAAKKTNSRRLRKA